MDYLFLEWVTVVWYSFDRNTEGENVWDEMLGEYGRCD